MPHFLDLTRFRLTNAALVLFAVAALLSANCPAAAQELILPPDDAPIVESANAANTAGSLRSPRALPVVGGTWTAQGPGPAYGGQVEGITNLEVAGAIHTVIAHPTDADIVWLGGVNGGVWKTTNAQAASPTWTQLTDVETSLSIGAMDLDPTDGTHQTLVAGFGRYSSFGRAGGRITGGLRSTDGGATWTSFTHALLESESCSGIAARGATLLFASGENFGVGGLFRSTDTGASWTKIDGGGGTGLPAGDLHDLVGDPNVSTRFYLTSDELGVFRSDDTGATWVNISDAAQQAVFAGGGNNNAELAVAPNGRVYVAIILNGQSRAIEYTDNPTAGTPTWTAMDLPSTPTGAGLTVTDATNATPIVITFSASHGFASGNYVSVQGVTGNTAANGVFAVTPLTVTTVELRLSAGNGAYAGGGTATKVNTLNPGSEKPGGQGSIHFSILVDAADSTIVYVGGDRQDLDTFPNFLGASNYTGRLWRGDTTVSPTGASPSPQWEHLTHSDSVGAIPGGGTASNSAPHADSREMVMDVNGDIIETDDGGIYRRTSPTDNTGDWISMNGTVQINEQHDVAYDTVSNIIISGNQDTGTTQQRTPGSLLWDSVSTADGGDVAVDTISSLPNSIRYSSFQNLGSFRRRTYNSSNVLQSQVFPALTGSAGWIPIFVTTVEVNAVNGARIVIGGANGILESLNRGDSVTFLSTASINEDCLAYGSNGVEEVLYAAANTSVLVRLTGSGAPVATAAAFPGAYIRGIVVDPTDQNTAYVIDTTQVFVTANAGASWTNITGDLVGSDFTTLEFLSGSPSHIAVGGLGGVYAMNVTTPGTWEQLGTDLPTAIVFDLDYDPVDEVLVAGTLGRGAWLLDDLVSPEAFTVTPGDFASSGAPGGAFTPGCKTYTVTNSSGGTINWTAATDAFWLKLTPVSGSLTTGQSVDVNVCVNTNPVYATPGEIAGTITFTNTTDMLVKTRGATLTVSDPNLTGTSFPLDSNPGWTTTGEWDFGTPAGQGGTSFGFPDPTSGDTGTNVFGVNLSGDYSLDIGGPFFLTTGPVDLSQAITATLAFQRWLNSDFQPYATATVEISTNGSSWTLLWENSDSLHVTDSSWVDQTFDITSIAAGQSTVYVRWGYSVAFDAYSYSGWNIDDVSITGTTAPRDNVWVDFGHNGAENGTSEQPYNTLGEAIAAVSTNGLVRIKGNTGTPNSSEKILNAKPVTIQSNNGRVQIGQN